MPTLKDLDLTNEELLGKLAKNPIIYSGAENQAYQFVNGAFNKVATPTTDAEQKQMANLDTNGALTFSDYNGGMNSDLFKYYNPQAKEQARVATSNFGMGSQPDFRPRGANESVQDYLLAKQAGGNTGIQLGLTTEQLRIANEQNKLANVPTFQTTGQGTSDSSKWSIAQPKIADLTQPTTRVLNEADLQSKREELGRLGIPTSEWNKYISSPDAQGNIFYTSPTPKTNLTADNISGTTSAVKLPGVNGGGTEIADAMVTGAQTNIQQIIAQLTPAETETEKKEQSLLDQMASLTGDLAQKSADQLTAEQSAGLPDLRNQFADINSQILTKMAEYKVLQEANKNKPITMNSIIGNERAIMNAQASDIGLLQARAQGLQGQIETAQNTVNRAIDLKYGTIEAQLSVQQAQLNAIQPTLNKEEQIRAEAQQLLITQQQQALSDKKAEEANIQNVMLDAINVGITDTSILSQISNAKDLNTAIKIYGANVPVGGIGIDATTEYKNWSLAGGQVGTGMTFAEWQGKETPGTIPEQSDYMKQTAQRAIQTINELVPQISANTTGWGAFFLNKLPESEARTFDAQLNTLKSNIAFGALTAMREASKTGGALGQVSDREGKLLESTLGALDQLQSGEQLKGQLNKIKESINRWNSALGASTNSNMSDFNW